jgi:hypothetical protein
MQESTYVYVQLSKNVTKFGIFFLIRILKRFFTNSLLPFIPKTGSGAIGGNSLSVIIS